MKVLFLTLMIVAAAFAAGEIQHSEAELPKEFQVEFISSSLQYYVDFLKGFFVEESNRSYPLFKQCDSRWANDVISTKTLCQVGCLENSVSMALAGLGKSIDGHSIDPHVLNSWLKSHGGYSGNLFNWGSVTSPFSLSYEGQFNDVTKYANNDSYIVILNVHNGGHWVLATSYSGGTWKVNDPGYNTSSYTNGEVSLGAVYRVK